MTDALAFDESFDVVVVGYGFAGALAAITAADQGARVLLAEKESNPGGISICSGGAMRSAHNADEAFAYLKATNAGRTPDDVLRVLADGMAGIENEVRKLAAVSNAENRHSREGRQLPFPWSRHLLSHQHHQRARLRRPIEDVSPRHGATFG